MGANWWKMLKQVSLIKLSRAQSRRYGPGIEVEEALVVAAGMKKLVQTGRRA